MLGRSFSGKTARGPRRRGACGKGRRSTCPRFLACYSNTNKDCIERYERGEVKRRFSTQPRRVGTLRGDPRPAARCGERDFFRSNDDEYKQARLLSKSHHHYSPRAAKLNNARRAELPRGTASSAMVSPRPTSGGGGKSRFTLLGGKKAMCRGGGSRAQGLVRAGVVPTTPRSLERVRREMSHLLVVLCRPGNFCSFSL
jgi:hypothetical protein